MNALMTDRYELTMLDSFVKSGKVEEQATFEVFTRRLPTGRRYGVFAGLGRLLPMLEDLTFSAREIDFLHKQGVIGNPTREWLLDRAQSGPKVQIDAYPEGELFFPHSPVMTVTGPLGDCILMETLILSVLNFDSAIATTAARMVSSAQGRPLIEMGSRRTNEDAAVAAARAAYVAGFDATSNLAAGYVYDIPTTGTAAHAFILSHDDERQAFKNQVQAMGLNTTLLVDTYDIEQGIKNAIGEAGTMLGAVRIDSGDLVYEVHKARELLDSLGAYMTKIVVSSDLDEYIIKDLRDAPVDSYGVGTKLVSSAPIGFVYKLVEIEGRPVAKKAKDKVSVGGRKTAWRSYKDGKLVEELTTPYNAYDYQHGPVQVFDITNTQLYTLEASRNFHKEAKDKLPIGEQAVWYGDHGPYITVEQR